MKRIVSIVLIVILLAINLIVLPFMFKNLSNDGKSLVITLDVIIVVISFFWLKMVKKSE